jgi:hypothetical protein
MLRRPSVKDPRRQLPATDDDGSVIQLQNASIGGVRGDAHRLSFLNVKTRIDDAPNKPVQRKQSLLRNSIKVDAFKPDQSFLADMPGLEEGEEDEDEEFAEEKDYEDEALVRTLTAEEEEEAEYA